MMSDESRRRLEGGRKVHGMTVILEVQDLKTSFVTEDGMVDAVDGVSLTIRSGEVLGVVGESGCGKSVTADSIMRLLDDDSTEYEGHIVFDGGTDLLELPESTMRREYRGNRIGMIFQDPMGSLNPVFTIGNQLIEAVRSEKPLSKQEKHQKALDALTLTRVPDPELRMTQYPHQLSGGQLQRVVIAMALIAEPELLIADEPTTALDVTNQKQILSTLRSLQDRLAAGIMFITHDLGVVAEICDRVVVMYLGQVIEEADVWTLFDSPKHPYTRGLLGSTPSMSTDSSQDLPVISGSVPTLNDVPSGCRFAPRCPFAVDACRSAEVELRTYEEDGSSESEAHRVRCIRAEELSEIVADASNRAEASKTKVDDQ